jgi:hypothetical protein
MIQSNGSIDVRALLPWGLLAVLLVVSGVAVAAPRGDLPERPREVIAAGYTDAAVTDVALQGTLGQPFVGLSRSDGVALGQGFWYGLGEVTYRIYLPLVIRSSH